MQPFPVAFVRRPKMLLASGLCFLATVLFFGGPIILVLSRPSVSIVTPGAATFEVRPRVDGVVYHEYRTKIDGRQIEVPPFDGLDCSIAAVDGMGGVDLADGRPIDQMYTWPGRQARSRYIIRADRKTTARLTCRYGAGQTAVTAEPAINPLPWILLAIGGPLSVVLFVASIVLFVVSLVPRSNPPRAMAPLRRW